jgi:SAM-dependent methyltransferase
MGISDFSAWLREAITHPLRHELARDDMSPMDTQEFPAAMEEPELAPPSGPPPTWTPTRLAVEERLWGVGFMSPGGDSELARYARPLGLTSAATVLLLGTATGGPPHLLARELGVWVVGHEADPVLCHVAATRLAQADHMVAKRVSITGFDPLAASFRPRFCNHAITQDAVRDAPLKPLLTAIAKALKPQGQIVLAEFVADHPLNPADPAIAAWGHLEGRGPGLHSAAAITHGLTRLGFDVRVEEDVTALHIQLAMRGWHDMVHQLAEHRPTRAQAAAIVLEAELWTRRLRLMHSGQLRLVRWHAFSGTVVA